MKYFTSTHISLFLAAIALVIFGAGCSAQVANNTNTDSTNTNLTEEIDTSDWLTYENEEYGFGFQYPSEWSVELNPREQCFFLNQPQGEEKITLQEYVMTVCTSGYYDSNVYSSLTDWQLQRGAAGTPHDEIITPTKVNRTDAIFLEYKNTDLAHYIVANNEGNTLAITSSNWDHSLLQAILQTFTLK